MDPNIRLSGNVPLTQEVQKKRMVYTGNSASRYDRRDVQSAGDGCITGPWICNGAPCI